MRFFHTYKVAHISDGHSSYSTLEEIKREAKIRCRFVFTCGQGPITKLPRGFAFVAFSDAASAARALEDSHVIHGRTVEVKKAIPRMKTPSALAAPPPWTKKIFVGGLSSNLTDEQFRNYFEKFGRTTDAIVMQDSLKNPRGFGFVTFDSEESVAKVMRNSFHELNGKTVEDLEDLFGCFTNGPSIPFMPAAGMFPYSNACLYPTYMHDASSIWGMEVVGHNQIVEPGVNGEVDVVHDSNVHFPSNATAPPGEEGNVGSESFGLNGGDVDAVHDSNGRVVPGINGEEVGHNQTVEPGVNGEVDAIHGSNEHVPSNATAPPSEESKVGSDALGLKSGDVDAVPDSNRLETGVNGGDVDVVPDINGHFEPDVNGEEVGGYNQIVEPDVNGEEVGGYNQIVEPGVNGEVYAFRESNGHVPSNATAPPSEEGKVGSGALGFIR
ncbi:RNA-binding protein [Salix suchowensis]|nr:RNA-binding protein [Salix suchowensis]